MKKMIFLLLLVAIVFSAKSQWINNPSVNTVLCNKVGSDYDPVAVSDGANGSILFFIDYANEGIHAQRMTTAGMVAWGSSSNPVNVCVSAGEKFGVSAVADGAGGAFVAWTDYRHNANFGEIYIQKISASGIAEWTANGLRVTNNILRDDLLPLLCLDAAGGVIVTWYGDDSVAQTIQSYAQRYNSIGAAQWTANGVLVSTAAGFRASSSIVPDGANGAFIFLLDTRNDPNGLNYNFIVNNNLVNSDIYGQRLNAVGSRQWTNEGAAIITAPGNQNHNLEGSAIPDGSGNVILVFDDGRNDGGSFTNVDVFAQKVNSNGVPQWTANGIAVCTAAENQFVNDIVSDGAAGVIVSISYENVSRCYAQRITSAGAVAWTVDGVPVSEVGEIVSGGALAIDGSGNSIFAYNSGNFNFVTAQKLNGAGLKQWGAGSIVCNNPAGTLEPVITASSAGSVIIAWSDFRNAALPAEIDIYASKVSPSGLLFGGGSSAFTTIASGNWNNPAIWLGGMVPPVAAVVVIRHNVIGNVNASCATITIQAPGNLTVNNGISITTN